MMYMASPWTFAVQELLTKATTHSRAALTSKGSERHAMPVQCQNIPSTICIWSGTVRGCHEAVVRVLPSSHLRWRRSPSSSSTAGSGRQLVIRHFLWTRLGVKRAMTKIKIIQFWYRFCYFWLSLTFKVLLHELRISSIYFRDLHN